MKSRISTIGLALLLLSFAVLSGVLFSSQTASEHRIGQVSASLPSSSIRLSEATQPDVQVTWSLLTPVEKDCQMTILSTRSALRAQLPTTCGSHPTSAITCTTAQFREGTAISANSCR